MTSTPSATTATTPPVPHLIVFGPDEAGKAHASWFTQAEAALAIRAAGLMGMATLVVTTDAHRTEAAKLARGRLFASGSAFVPFANAATYERLRALAGQADAAGAAAAKVEPKSAAPAPTTLQRANTNSQASNATAKPAAGSQVTPTASSSHRPAHWGEIRVGSLVLAPEHDNISWWAAVVMRAEDQDRFTLKWRDFWHEAPFSRRLDELGLLLPAPTSR